MPHFEDKVNFQVKSNNKKYSRVYPETEGDEIVISGMAGKFPNCENVAELQYKLYNKVCMSAYNLQHFPTEFRKVLQEN